MTTGTLIDRAREVLATYEPREATGEARWDAAVLLLLYYHAGSEHVLLTERTHTVEHHKGQVSFPGGGRHGADEDLQTTALRETWEEVGIHPDHVEVIGRLDEMITISDFRVRPFVGVLHQTPYEYLLQPEEVERVLEVPLAYLLDPANRLEEPRALPDGRLFVSPYWEWDGARIWGATARMLDGFLALMRGDDAG